ncbi:MAG: hypothetical protein KTR14_09265, partial [Vampirovibrio sp.]|nr:hypothetical protein [Vampirovibrio sp.]
MVDMIVNGGAQPPGGTSQPVQPFASQSGYPSQTAQTPYGQPQGQPQLDFSDAGPLFQALDHNTFNLHTGANPNA